MGRLMSLKRGARPYCWVALLLAAPLWLVAQSLQGEWRGLRTELPARSHHAMAWDPVRAEMVIFGGGLSSPGGTDDTWVWNGRLWFQRSPSIRPPARSGAAMAYDPVRRQIVLFGGWNSAQSVLFGDTWIWDGVNWSRRFPSRSPSPRASHRMVWDAARQEILLFGGWGNGLFNDTWAWDGSNWIPRQPTDGMPPPHSDHAMVYDEARQEVVAFGGCCGGTGRLGHRDTTWVWDGRTWLQRWPETKPPARAAHAMAYDPVRHWAILFGGQDSNGGLLNDTWLWNGSNWVRLPTVSSPPPCAYAAMVYDPPGERVLLTGCSSEHTTWVLSLRGNPGWPEIRPAGIVSAASYASGGVAPGEILAFFGENLGPPDLVPLQLNSAGKVATELAGTKVLFDGIAAPLIYARRDQLSAVAPLSLAGRSTTEIKIVRNGVESGPVRLPVAAARPGLFTQNASGKGQAAALNQDGSLNSKDRPAAHGSVVVLFATGAGAMSPQPEDGAVIQGETLPRPLQPISVSIGGQPAEVLYAGAAPGLVAGVIQINARVPPSVSGGDAVPVVVNVGSASSQPGVTIAVGATAEPLRISGFRIDPPSVIGGQQARGAIALNRPVAPGEAFRVELRRDDNAALFGGTGDFYVGPAALGLLFLPGTSSRELTILTCGVLSTQRVTFTASGGGTTLSRTLTVDAGEAEASLSRTSVTGGESVTGSVQLSGPAGCGAFASEDQLSLESSHSVVRVPAVLRIPAGQTTAQFPVQTDPVSTTVTATIRVFAAGRGERKLSLTLLPRAGGGISFRNRLFEIHGTLTVGNSSTGLRIVGIAEAWGDGLTYLITIDNGTDLLRYPQFIAIYKSVVQPSGNRATFAGQLTGGPDGGIYSLDGLRVYSINSITLVIDFTSLTTHAPVSGRITFVTSGGTFQGVFSGTITLVD